MFLVFFLLDKKCRKSRKQAQEGPRQMSLAAESFQSDLDGAQECH